ncbi:hypothetical protein C440_03758 [Haloferax mucosum ATCC BAA-1512]|uniref:Uncharacterized protein n=1 Tax=Haloferax mucosum ATCC BAA-1512 TaxID=662479 RepID=M0IN10_9EURY|nr:hypothetical protein C440_03758 [Haloferax mucosum ATCC BAA-1512]
MPAMTYDIHLVRLDAPDTTLNGFNTVAEAVFLALAAVLGTVPAIVVATVVASFAPSLGVVALFSGWSVGSSQ